MQFKDFPYTRVSTTEAEVAITALLARFADAKSPHEQLIVHADFNRFRSKYLTAMSLSYIRYTLDTADEYYLEEHEYYDKNAPFFTRLEVAFYRALCGSPFRAELEKTLGKLLFTNVEMMLTGFSEEIMAELSLENELVTQYQKLRSQLEIDFRGERLNLPQLRFYMLSDDRETRREAYAKNEEAFMSIAPELDRIFGELVGLRTSMAKKLGYEDYVPLGYVNMQRNCYNEKKIADFRAQVKSYLVPFVTSLHEKRKESLAVDSLKIYDENCFFPNGSPAPIGTPAEIFERGKEMYTRLSPKTGEFIRFMLEQDLFDCLAKKGKSGGGYCDYIPDFEAPFVFANFNATSEDVDVLTHECGHALNSYLAKNITPAEYMHPTFDVAEIHSMAMELFTSYDMDLFFGDRAADFRYMQLLSAIMFVPYGCLVDEWQHVVYHNPGLTPEQRHAEWQKLEREYLPHLDSGDGDFYGKGRRWQGQSHIYERPFYYIDYCLAQLVSLSYFLMMEDDFSAAFENYLALSAQAGTKTFSDLVSAAGFSLPYDDGFMEKLIADIKPVIDKLFAAM